MLGLLVFAAAVGAMGRLCTHEFIDWDDSATIYSNPRLNPPTWGTLKFYWTHGEYGLFIPGTYTVWAGLSAIARTAEEDTRGIRLNPHVFHTASVVLHGLAAMAVFGLLRRLKKLPDVACAIGAALYAVHPVQVESVGWVSGMKDVLCGLFSIVALWQYVASAQADTTRWRRIHFVIATLAFGWALVCKPTAMVVPAIAVALDWIVLRRDWRQALWATALWWPMALACMITARMQQTTLGAIPPALWLRPLIALDAIAFYLRQIVYPGTLAVDYGRTPEAALANGWVWWTWIVPVAVAGMLAWKPKRELIAAGLILVIGVSPVLGLTPFMFQFYSTVSDHYLYLAMLGPALALACVITHLPQRAVMGGAVGALVVLAALSVKQAGTWKDDEALYAQAIAVNPNSFMAYNNLGSAYTHAADVAMVGADVAEKVGDRDAAAAYRKQADAEYRAALAMFEKCAEARMKVNGGKDDFLKAHGNMAAINSRLGNNAQALHHRQRALAILLTYPREAQRDLAGLHFMIGQDLIKLGRAAEAIRAYDEALKMEPGDKMVIEARAKAQTLVSMQQEMK